MDFSCYFTYPYGDSDFYACFFLIYRYLGKRRKYHSIIALLYYLTGLFPEPPLPIIEALFSDVMFFAP
jgi:hypothetical protein